MNRAPVRRPRFGELVVLGPLHHRLVATRVAPRAGYIIRPVEARDAGRDRVLSPQDWAVLRWNRQLQRWDDDRPDPPRAA